VYRLPAAATYSVLELLRKPRLDLCRAAVEQSADFRRQRSVGGSLSRVSFVIRMPIARGNVCNAGREIVNRALDFPRLALQFLPALSLNVPQSALYACFITSPIPLLGKEALTSEIRRRFQFYQRLLPAVDSKKKMKQNGMQVTSLRFLRNDHWNED